MFFNYVALAFDLFAIAFFMVSSYSLHAEESRKGASYYHMGLAAAFAILSVWQIHTIIEGMIANAV